MIPLHRAAVAGDEVANVTAALGEGAAGGPWSERAAATLSAALDDRPVLLTTSCTAALELAALLLDVGPGDTVVVPSFTFPTTASAFARAGAAVRFCDVERATLGLDPARLAELMDETVVAVVAVHYAGAACDVAGIEAVLAAWPRARLVEDAAHGLFGRSGDRPLGALGSAAALSFHQTKTFGCGEGGALVLGPDLDEARAWRLWDKGTDRQAFLHGEVSMYTWQEVGSSFGLADGLAAVLVAQLGARDTWLAHRRAAVRAYLRHLTPEADALGLTLLPHVGDDASAAHLFPVLLPAGVDRSAVIADLAAAGVASAFHFVPLHAAAAGRRADPGAACPVADDVAARLLRLPLDSVITDVEVATAATTLQRVLRDRR